MTNGENLDLDPNIKEEDQSFEQPEGVDSPEPVDEDEAQKVETEPVPSESD